MYRVRDEDGVTLYEGRDRDEAYRVVYSVPDGKGGTLEHLTKDGWQYMIVWRD